jgi:lipopolysaccharide/colanic/teichoic acid biosynthesis glycosyltransferase
VAKRLLDFCVAALGLLVLLPPLLLIAIAIKLDSPGPVFFRQTRVGREGVSFRIFKFRTMTHGGTRGRQLTTANDTRITRVGRWLRASKLDELPQLIDVLRGTMSLVGPRPEVPKYVEHYPPHWRDRLLSVRPGITDFASVHYRDEGELLARADDPEKEYVEVILPLKLSYSLHYVDSPNIANDLRVIGLTLKTVFAPAIQSARQAMTIQNTEFWTRLEQAMSALNRRNRLCSTLCDGVVILACWHVTYLFRLGFERWQPGRPWYDDYVSFGVVAGYLIALALAGVPRGLWRYFGVDDFRRIVVACTVAGAVGAVWILMAQLSGVARAVLVLHPFFCMLGLSAVRIGYRLLWEHAKQRTFDEDSQPKRVIVLGADDLARRFIEATQHRQGWEVLMLLDDNPNKQGLRIAGITVKGTVADLAWPHVHAGATHVIVGLQDADEGERARAQQLARNAGLTVMRMSADMSLDAELPH